MAAMIHAHTHQIPFVYCNIVYVLFLAMRCICNRHKQIEFSIEIETDLFEKVFVVCVCECVRCIGVVDGTSEAIDNLKRDLRKVEL